jgi:steroid 5-alpha reductase family enzyme
LPVWVGSVVRRDASLIDRFWPWLIAAPCGVYFAVLPGHPRAWLAGALVLLWAARLSAHLTWRNWGHGEDRRYQAMRARDPRNFGRRSLWSVFGLQALLAWVVGWPVLATLAGAPSLGGLAVLGAALAGTGVVFEAVADAQLARFRSQGRPGAVLQTGLWRWSRHPNYFGEACIWWGLWLIAMDGGWGAGWTVVSPLLMTVLLLRVSGVRLLERDLVERRPAYRDYVARTSAFIPWPPKTPAPASSTSPAP